MDNKQADILIVDDFPDNLILLGNVLTKAGYKVRPAPSGKLALRAAEHEPPDLIMLDITMPEMDGFEVCRQLKANPKLAPIPIIFISALTDTVDKVRAFDEGGVDYVTKPFEVKEVLSRVKAHCLLRQAQTELDEKNEVLEKSMAELRAAQVQLVQHEKMASLGVLTAGIAHEINNPINFVNSGVKGLVGIQADLLQLLDAYENSLPRMNDDDRRFIEETKQKIDYVESRVALDELTSSIFSGVKRTAEIVDGLRVFSHTGRQGKKLIDVGQNVDSAIMLQKNKIKDRIEIVRDYDEVPTLLCLPGPINQVFMNLISNAIDAVCRKYSTDGGSITIRVSKEERDGKRGICVAIADNGDGIDPDALEHVFEPFFTTHDVGGGVGLGLSISHGIVAEHKGLIEVTTTPEGACFSVWLPLQVETKHNGGKL